MDGWIDAQLHHYGTSYSGGAYGAPPYDPEPPVCPDCYHEYCVCPPVDIDADAYLAWWEEEVAAGRIVAPEHDEAVTHG
jgi:hypothetical protein